MTLTATKRASLLILAGMIAVASIAYGRFLGFNLLEKYPPDWTSYGVAKSAGLLGASFLGYLALRPSELMARPMRWEELPPFSLITGMLVLLISAAAVLFWPEHISGFVRETKPISVITDYILSAALVLIGYAIFKSRGHHGPTLFGPRPVWVLSIMFLVVFIILMEEMSWGQHLLGFSTPDAFRANIQNETNLHNFYTYRFEAAYYSAAVLAFVILPFAWPASVPSVLKSISPYIPPAAFSVMALPLCGIFYETWNYVPYQIWFFLGIIVAIHFWQREANKGRRMVVFAMAISLFASQAVFLGLGHMMIDGHELTEIREFAIALALAAYGYVMAMRMKKSNPEEWV